MEDKLSQESKRPELSEREQQLMTLAAQGFTDTAIAQRLGISEPTIKSYWVRVRSKLGPYNRTELVAHALREEGARAVSVLKEEIGRLKTALEGSARDALALQREMLENAPDAVFAVDQEGRFVWLNLEAERMFGYRFDELVGKPVSTLVPPDVRNLHLIHVRKYIDEPVRKRMGEHLATTALRKNGEVFPVAATLASMETPNGRIVTCFVREVVENEALAAFVANVGAKLE